MLAPSLVSIQNVVLVSRDLAKYLRCCNSLLPFLMHLYVLHSSLDFKFYLFARKNDSQSVLYDH